MRLSRRVRSPDLRIVNNTHLMNTTTTELNLETILYAKKGPIAYVTLNRPKVLNALNKRTWEDLKAAFEDAQDDAAVRGVILTGAGDKAFIAGADISEIAQISAVEAEQSSTFGQGVLDLTRKSRQAGDRSRERLRAWWRMRNSHGMHNSNCC